MTRLPEFVCQMLTVVAGVFFLVMSAAFIMLPYSLGAHPGEAQAHVATSTYHSS
jgi:hypothetical protein